MVESQKNLYEKQNNNVNKYYGERVKELKGGGGFYSTDSSF